MPPNKYVTNYSFLRWSTHLINSLRHTLLSTPSPLPALPFYPATGHRIHGAIEPRNCPSLLWFSRCRLQTGLSSLIRTVSGHLKHRTRFGGLGPGQFLWCHFTASSIALHPTISQTSSDDTLDLCFLFLPWLSACAPTSLPSSPSSVPGSSTTSSTTNAPNDVGEVRAAKRLSGVSIQSSFEVRLLRLIVC